MEEDAVPPTVGDDYAEFDEAAVQADETHDIHVAAPPTVGDVVEPWTGYPNRWGSEFEGSPCGSCGHNTNGDATDSDQCADLGCHGCFEAWTPPTDLHVEARNPLPPRPAHAPVDVSDFMDKPPTEEPENQED